MRSVERTLEALPVNTVIELNIEDWSPLLVKGRTPLVKGRGGWVRVSTHYHLPVSSRWVACLIDEGFATFAVQSGGAS